MYRYVKIRVRSIGKGNDEYIHLREGVMSLHSSRHTPAQDTITVWVDDLHAQPEEPSISPGA